MDPFTVLSRLVSRLIHRLEYFIGTLGMERCCCSSFSPFEVVSLIFLFFLAFLAFLPFLIPPGIGLESPQREWGGPSSGHFVYLSNYRRQENDGIGSGLLTLLSGVSPSVALLKGVWAGPTLLWVWISPTVYPWPQPAFAQALNGGAEKIRWEARTPSGVENAINKHHGRWRN